MNILLLVFNLSCSLQQNRRLSTKEKASKFHPHANEEINKALNKLVEKLHDRYEKSSPPYTLRGLDLVIKDFILEFNKNHDDKINLADVEISLRVNKSYLYLISANLESRHTNKFTIKHISNTREYRPEYYLKIVSTRGKNKEQTDERLKQEYAKQKSKAHTNFESLEWETGILTPIED